VDTNTNIKSKTKSKTKIKTKIKTKTKTKIKIKGDGQECPSHKGSYNKRLCALLHVGKVKTSTSDSLHREWCSRVLSA